MPASSVPDSSRQQRRREQTRARLIAAAKNLVAVHGVDGVGLSEITEAADLGAGTFYNYFRSRDDIVEAVVEESIESVGARLDKLTASLSDPAEVFSFSLRHLVRQAVTDPVWGWFVVRLGVAHPKLLAILGPRCARDLRQGVDSGRFTIPDIELATACVFGALLSTLRYTLSRESAAHVEETFAQTMLGMVGVPADEAWDVASRELPDLPGAE
ncbi:TetR/AcrR family transcriptional regulator [Amycolatopsis bartoniae]|uniref:TetR/AcrR family transcriptional regulator n=1 Tax=Amycolatopsis bartoniae TaxID=941986 RepID=UPI00119314D1|nr:TetR/AcrR family transcriptional regulator [Amycolatopsis bartoniae]TVT10192.1 TetR/AcrR family transcriptional regulator [Amycolatopsis bartoniae]